MHISELSANAVARKVGSSGYAGELTASEVVRYCAAHSDGVIVDVRTDAEWQSVGVVDAANLQAQVVYLSWRMLPQMQINPDFLTQLTKCVPDVASAIFFLCRSGVRSYEAATMMAEHGYTHCFNIIGGCESVADGSGRPNGWKAEGMPWVQA
jgi:rhodanese-related sulfurtransferase